MKLFKFTFRRKNIRQLLIIIISFVIFLALFFRGRSWITGYRSPQWIGYYVRHVNTSEKVIALTFDDGPNPPYTNQILSVLDNYDVKATFFVIGLNALRYPEIIKQIQTNGHEIGNHSWDHQTLVFRKVKYVRNEIKYTDNLLKSYGYQGEIYFRAPEGRKFIVLPWVLFTMKKKDILFDVVAKDWEQPPDWHLLTVDHMFERVNSQAHSGSIILLHDGGGIRSNTVELTKKIVKYYLKEGYRFVTISDLLKYN